MRALLDSTITEDKIRNGVPRVNTTAGVIMPFAENAAAVRIRDWAPADGLPSAIAREKCRGLNFKVPSNLNGKANLSGPGSDIPSNRHALILPQGQ